MVNTATKALAFMALLNACSGIQIMKTWNGAATRGKVGVMAVRTDIEMLACSWTTPDGDTYTSGNSEEDDIEVVLLDGDEDNSLCKVVIGDVSSDHDGEWSVTVYSNDCDDDKKRRKKRQAVEQVVSNPVKFPGQAPQVAFAAVVSNTRPVGGNKKVTPPAPGAVNLPGAATVQTEFLKAKEVSRSALKKCAERATQHELKFSVASSSKKLEAIVAQENVIGVSNKKVTLSLRTSAKLDGCVVEFDGDEVTELTSRGRGDCNDDFEGSKVCVENFESDDKDIFACNVIISKMQDEHVGEWEIEAEMDGETKKATINLYEFEKPKEVKMYLDGKEVDEDDDEIELEEGEDVEIMCSASRGDPDPVMRLYIGKGEVIVDKDDISSCKEDDHCTEFKFEVDKDMKGEDLKCVATYMDVDALKDKKLMASFEVKLDGNGGDEPIRLTAIDEDEDEITICTGGESKDDDFTIEIEFEADEEPEEVTWKMNQNSGTKATIRAGKSSGRYKASKVKTEDSEEGEYVVELEIEEMSRYDLTKENHELVIELDDGSERTFTFTLDDDKDCDEGGSSRNSDEEAIRLASYEEDEDEITICTGGKEKDDDFTIKLEFEADEEPEEVTWKMNQNSGSKATIRAGKSSGRYKASKIETEDSDEGEYSIELEIEEMTKYDLTKENHELIIELDDGTERTFTFTLDDDEDCEDGGGSSDGSSSIEQCDEDDDDCECVEIDEDDDDKLYCCSSERNCRGDNCCEDCDKGDDNCFCDSRGRNCYEVPLSEQLTGSSIKDKAIKIMVDSCLDMSAALLKTYNPDGSKRDDDDEEDFKEKLDEFFEDATCTKFDDDIQDYYNGKSKAKASSTRTSQPLKANDKLRFGESSVSFNKATPGGRVGIVAATLAAQKVGNSVVDAAAAAERLRETQEQLKKADERKKAKKAAKKAAARAAKKAAKKLAEESVTFTEDTATETVVTEQAEGPAKRRRRK